MKNQRFDKETEQEKDRRLNQEVLMEKLKTPDHEVKKFKTLAKLLEEEP